MRRLILWAVALAAGLALPMAAMASPGFVTTNLNLRAGPSTGFPVVDTIPDGARVNIHGCLSDYAWCDVSWSGARGWADSNYLQSLYDGRRVLIVDYGDEIGFPILTFDIGTYWGHYYRHRPFYGRLNFWRQRYASDYRLHRHHARGGVHRRAIAAQPAGRATVGVRHNRHANRIGRAAVGAPAAAVVGHRGHRARIAAPAGRHHRAGAFAHRASPRVGFAHRGAPRAGHVAQGAPRGPSHVAAPSRATTGAAVAGPHLNIGGGGHGGPHGGGRPAGGHGGGGHGGPRHH